MRLFTPRFALGLGLFATIFAVADAAQAGIIFNRGARRAAYYDSNAYATPVASADPCCCEQGGYSYGQPMYSGGYSYGPTYYRGGRYVQPMPSPYPGARVAGYTPNYIPGTGPTPVPGTGLTVPSPLPTQPDIATQSVSINDNAFEPANLTIQPGQTVKWTNNGKHQHTVTSDKGDWGSAELAPGQTFTATFTKAGTFDYHCNLHKDLKGTITVR